MPIPNVANLYQRIHKGAEGGNEFARFLKLLLTAEYERKGERFIAKYKGWISWQDWLKT